MEGLHVRVMGWQWDGGGERGLGIEHQLQCNLTNLRAIQPSLS